MPEAGVETETTGVRRRTVMIRTTVVRPDSPSVEAKLWAESALVTGLGLAGFAFFALAIFYFFDPLHLRLQPWVGPFIVAATVVVTQMVLVFPAGSFGLRVPLLILRPDEGRRHRLSWFWWSLRGLDFLHLWKRGPEERLAALVRVDRGMRSRDARDYASRLASQHPEWLSRAWVDRPGDARLQSFIAIFWILFIVLLDYLLLYTPTPHLAALVALFWILLFVTTAMAVLLDSYRLHVKDLAKWTRLLRKLEGFEPGGATGTGASAYERAPQ